jgi:polysaccharide pyruvyl transferase WcaK-like protein
MNSARIRGAGLCPGPAGSGRGSRILLRSSWQTVNIGDVGHTPGVLALLEKHFPEAEVRLWPVNIGDGVREMLLRRFPDLRIVQSAADVRASFRECDFLLHGSGPYLVAARDVRRWHTETGKPYGVFGITLSTCTPEVKDLLIRAAFVFFRDSVSLAFARGQGIDCPLMEFGPDGAFAVDLRDDAAAESFLAAHGLEPGGFLCCVPRYRHTPYWRITDRPIDPDKAKRNEAMKEHDHAPLREAIIRVVRNSGMKILVCPEDRTQMAIGREMIVEKLPADVRRSVVRREQFWLTAEAVGIYMRSAGLFGLEMHSPILCIGNGIPAIVGRFAEQTSKGFMWRDIGLGEWLFDLDQPDQAAQMPAAIAALAAEPATAKRRAAAARERVAALQRRMVEVLRRWSPFS